MITALNTVDFLSRCLSICCEIVFAHRVENDYSLVGWNAEETLDGRLDQACVAKIGEWRDKTREGSNLQEVCGSVGSAEKEVGILIDSYQHGCLWSLIHLSKGVGKVRE